MRLRDLLPNYDLGVVPTDSSRYNRIMSVTTQHINIAHIPKLHKMFRRALHEDFAYFPGEYIEKVSKDNTRYSFLRAKLKPQRIMLGLYENGQLIGYAIADTTVSTDSDIFWFYIIPERRGNGLGKKFFAGLLSELTSRGASHVYLMTHNQRGFYEDFDFSLLGENSDLFEGITMSEMAKDLS